MDGFHNWASPSQADIDIILVHGPGGGPETTWTDDKSGVAWPKDKLAPVLEHARILSFIYEPALDDFFVLGDAPDSTMDRIDKLGTDLCKAVLKLEKYSKPVKKRLAFIAHSLGGLVCANILAKGSRYSEEFKQVAGRCVAMIFLATPFCGNDPEAWKTITEKLSTNVAAERNNCSGAMQVQQAFQNLVADRFARPKFAIENLVEAGDEDLPNVVVTADYAELESVTRTEFKADHQSISKCVDERNLVFEHILESLLWIERPARVNLADDMYPVGDAAHGAAHGTYMAAVVHGYYAGAAHGRAHGTSHRRFEMDESDESE